MRVEKINIAELEKLASIIREQNVEDGFKNDFENHDHFGGHVGHDKGHWGKGQQPAA